MKPFKGPSKQRGFLQFAALAISAASAIGGMKSAKEATKASQAANEAQRKANRLKNEQARRAFLRNFRQAQANVLVESVMAGVGLEGSRFQGTQASQASQTTTALTEFEQMDELGAEVAEFRNLAASRSGRASAFQGVSSLASSFISFSGSSTKTKTPPFDGVN